MEWEYSPNFKSNLPDNIQDKLKISSFLKTLLLNRGFSTADDIQKFLYPDFSSFRDPFDFENMEKVIETIVKVKNKGGKIFIYGDYDVDGITSAVFLTHAFNNIGINTDYYIPSRTEEEYGLDRKNLDYMVSCGAELVITVDTSISNIEDVRYGRSLGIDVIITDHHKSAKDSQDNEILYINPKLSENYNFKFLSGAGVALKVAQALYSHLGLDLNLLYDFLDIIMIGTVADVVPVVDENRLIIKEGLKKLKNTKIKGLNSLMKYLKFQNKDLSASDVSYFIAPLINSLGRIGTSQIGADFFTKTDEDVIYGIIEEMKKSNKMRRELEREIFQDAVLKIESDKDKYKNFIFLSSDTWHPGIIGIVASRLCIKYQLPTILVATSKGLGKASSRSLKGVNIFNIFKDVSHLLKRFGGHDLAAGFIADTDKLVEIETFISESISKTNFEKMESSLKIDMEFSIDKINEDIIKDLNLLSPFGSDNPQPIFMDKDLTFENIKKFGVDNKHFSGIINKNGKRFPIVGFDLGKFIDDSGYPIQKFDIAYYPEKSYFKNESFIQIKIKDVKIKDDIYNLFYK